MSEEKKQTLKELQKTICKANNRRQSYFSKKCMTIYITNC